MRSKTLNEVRFGNLDAVPQISMERVKILWFDDFHDGPLSGIAEVDDEGLLFDIIDRSRAGDSAAEEERKDWLVRLTQAQLADEEYWHEQFCEHVGIHWDCRGLPPGVHPQEEHRNFYEPYSKRPKPNFDSNEVVGWFSK